MAVAAATLTREDIGMILLEAMHNPRGRTWQVQGFGMLRTYLDDDRTRLQVWDQRLAVWGNGAIHDHPWDFTSMIYAGMLYNERYLIMEPQYSYPPQIDPAGEYLRVAIQPGVDGGARGEPEMVQLGRQPIEMYSAGESYSQRAHELHMTRYLQGTVTVITRERVTEADRAWSLWKANGVPWTFFKPRRATEREIGSVVGDAIRTWWLNT